MQLRSYQQDSKEEVQAVWRDDPKANVLLVKPTGAGKTVTMASIIHDHDNPCCAIAHRQELVGQIAMAHAREGIKHRIIAPIDVIKNIVRDQTIELGRSYYDPTAHMGVAGVDTLLRRTNINDWLKTITLWVQDEAHHVLRNNKWGKAAQLFPNAKGLGVTATPLRADGMGLGRWADGLFDHMVVGPTMRDLINQGYLTDYRIFAPPSDLLVTEDPGKSGDWSTKQLKTASRNSHIIGDVVEHYQRIAPNKRGVVFATDIETADDIAKRFNIAGIAAKNISSKNSDTERSAILRRFKAGELTVLVNVDLFGEGFDLPAIEVVSMARPTMSYGLYVQQFGRALRILEGKDIAIIIDHVGNVDRHGLPDKPRIWSLDRRSRRKQARDPDLIPTRTCIECLAVYEAIHPACTYCGAEWIPADRSGPEHVDGDLLELDPNVLKQMRGEISKIDVPINNIGLWADKKGFDIAARRSIVKKHGERQDAQHNLRDTIALWAGHQRAAGRRDSESYKRFYWRYGIDVLSAQALGKKEAEKLTEKIALDLLTL